MKNEQNQTILAGKVPAGYQQTEVGIIPEDWEVVKLGDICSFLKGMGLSKSMLVDDGAYQCIHYGELFTTYDSHIKNVLSTTNWEGKVLSAKNDILMPTSDVTPNGLATASCIMQSGIILGGDILIIRSEVDKLNGLFFSSLVEIKHNEIIKLVTGTTVYHLYAKDLSELVFALPTLKEQTAIATALSDVDSLLVSLEKLIEKKRAIKTGTMQQLLTGKKRLPAFAQREDGTPKGYKTTELGEIPEDWEVVKLGDICSFLKGIGLSKSMLVDDGAYQCIHYGELFTTYDSHIKNVLSTTNWEGKVLSAKNDILMPTSDVTPNGLSTASCIMQSGIILGGDILIIRSEVDKLNGLFFSSLVEIKHNEIIKLVTGTTVYHLYAKDLSELIFALPTLKEQTAIAEILSDMDAEIEALEAKRAKTEKIKQGMMQELLTGRTRLI